MASIGFYGSPISGNPISLLIDAFKQLKAANASYVEWSQNTIWYSGSETDYPSVFIKSPGISYSEEEGLTSVSGTVTSISVHFSAQTSLDIADLKGLISVERLEAILNGNDAELYNLFQEHEWIVTNVTNFAGGFFHDDITGTVGEDQLLGGRGNDRLDGDGGEDTLSGGRGNDEIFGGAGNDTLSGEDGDDKINGEDGNDTLYAGAGDDRIVGGFGIDMMHGGVGNDSFHVNNSSDTTYEKAGEGVDTVDSQVDFFLAAGAEIENLQTTNAFGVSDISLTGNEFAQTITGNSGANELQGMGDNDILYGLNGNDALFGGDGVDKLYGGAGNDALVGGLNSDILHGDGGNDIIDAGMGNDLISGGLASDKLTGGDGADRFIFKSSTDSTAASSGRDTISDFDRIEGDKIDLLGIDANTKLSGNQAFKFLGSASYTKTAGELRTVVKNGDTFIYGDVNGDGATDFSIMVDTSARIYSTDFIL